MAADPEWNHALDDFHKALVACKDPVAAAILVHSVRVDYLVTRVARLERHFKDFDHQICMGIRYGLFGTEADFSASLMDVNFAGEGE